MSQETTQTQTTQTTSQPQAQVQQVRPVRSEVDETVNSIMQKVIALALMDDEELQSEEGRQLIKSLRKDVKKFLLKSMQRS